MLRPLLSMIRNIQALLIRKAGVANALRAAARSPIYCETFILIDEFVVRTVDRSIDPVPSRERRILALWTTTCDTERTIKPSL
jgi:hypothetical protein